MVILLTGDVQTTPCQACRAHLQEGVQTTGDECNPVEQSALKKHKAAR